MRLLAVLFLCLLPRSAALAAESPLVVLMGDSEISAFSNYPQLLPANTVNLGVGGAITTETTARTPLAASLSPDKVFVLTGTNDVQSDNVSAFIANYGQLLDSLQTSAPNAKVYVSAIFPVNWSEFPRLQYSSNPVVDEYDAALKSLVEKSLGVTYVDYPSAFKDASGNLSSAYTADGLHLNAAGYSAWSRLLTQYF